jgi:hypothetical protein
MRNRMNFRKIIITFSIVLSPICTADISSIKGKWEAYSRSSQAIYGNIIITDNLIRWGVSTIKGGNTDKLPPCKAEYKYTFEKASNLHIIKLLTKTCNLKNMANPQFSKNLDQWNVRLTKELSKRIEAKFYDYSESGSVMGDGIFHKNNSINTTKTNQ